MRFIQTGLPGTRFSNRLIRRSLVNIAILFVLTFTNAVFANTPKDQTPSFNFGVGAGIQYGVIGAQFNFIHNNARIYLSTGILGGALGLDYAVSSNVSVGTSLFAVIVAGYSFNANYYFNSTFSSGWKIGVDLFNGVSGGGNNFGAFLSGGLTF